jgi:hypothetical protein
MAKRYTILIIVLLGLISPRIFLGNVYAQKQTNEENWEKWYQNAMLYINEGKAVLVKHGGLVNQCVQAMQGLQASTVTQAEKKQYIDSLSVEALKVLTQFRDEFSQIKPPAEFQQYRAYFLEALTAQKKEVEAAAKGQEVKQYSCEFISLLLKAAEELHKIFIAHNSPQWYLDSHAELIRELNQSLKSCENSQYQAKQ